MLMLNRDIRTIIDGYLVKWYRKLLNDEYISKCETMFSLFPYNIYDPFEGLKSMSDRIKYFCVLCKGLKKEYNMFCHKCWNKYRIDELEYDYGMLWEYGDLSFIAIMLHVRREEYLKQLF
jgi:hypothetical protein